MINKIEIDKIHYSEYIDLSSKFHSISSSYYPINDDSIKGLAAFSEVKKYLPSNHPHHSKNEIKQIKQVDDLEPLIHLLKQIE